MLCTLMQMYHYVHIIGFLGYTLFAMTHYGGMFVAFVPGGLLLTCLDCIFSACIVSSYVLC